MASNLLGPIEHVVVLMFENRSFDNVLGGLYPYSSYFEGVPPGWSNPTEPQDINPRVQAFQAPTGYEARIMPFPDPLEDHEDMMAQIDGGSMQGFLANYAKATKNDWAVARNIMQFYAPGSGGNIPITSALAQHYGVSDFYHGSGPVQTWPNRLFAHCGSPGFYTKDGKNYSYLNNKEYPHYPFMDGQLSLKSIFQQFDETFPNEKSWKIYYDGEWPISSIVEYIDNHWDWSGKTDGNVFEFRSDEYPDFFADVKNGTLPKYSFIEPRYQQDTLDPLKTIPPNSNHPGSASVVSGHPPIDIMHGEQLLKDIYKALVSNTNLFRKTLLIVTYDEHGGCFDHVAPPPATSPFHEEMSNFDYKLYGPRVPAIFINPYIQKNTVLRPSPQPHKASVFDHTSIISTLHQHFGLHGDPLTPRVSTAPVFENLISSVENTEQPELPELDLQWPKSTEVKNFDIDDVDRDSLNYVMYEAVLEKRRRLSIK